MTLNSTAKIFILLLLALSLSALTACASNEKAKPDHMTGGGIVGVNYTGEGIQSFSIDGTWGGNMGRYSGGGGTVCCARYPRTWSPDLKITVEWERSDCERQRHLCTLDNLKQGKWPLNKVIKKTVPIEKFIEPGEVYVLFFPKNEVRVYITNVGVGSKDFPGNPGYPEDHNPEKKK